MNLIKDSIDKIIFPITSIINLSITSGIVQSSFKVPQILSDNQYGFRKHHSTAYGMLSLVCL